jgi:hypothetical protein
MGYRVMVAGVLCALLLCAPVGAEDKIGSSAAKDILPKAVKAVRDLPEYSFNTTVKTVPPAMMGAGGEEITDGCEGSCVAPDTCIASHSSGTKFAQKGKVMLASTTETKGEYKEVKAAGKDVAKLVPLFTAHQSVLAELDKLAASAKYLDDQKDGEIDCKVVECVTTDKAQLSALIKEMAKAASFESQSAMFEKYVDWKKSKITYKVWVDKGNLIVRKVERLARVEANNPLDARKTLTLEGTSTTEYSKPAEKVVLDLPEAAKKKLGIK